MAIKSREPVYGYTGVVLEKHVGDKGHVGGAWSCFRCAYCNRQLANRMVKGHSLRFCYFCGERLVE